MKKRSNDFESGERVEFLCDDGAPRKGEIAGRMRARDKFGYLCQADEDLPQKCPYFIPPERIFRLDEVADRSRVPYLS